jgi:hypothetical protein
VSLTCPTCACLRPSSVTGERAQRREGTSIWHRASPAHLPAGLDQLPSSCTEIALAAA